MKKRKAPEPNYPLEFNRFIVTGDIDSFKRNFKEITKPPEYLSTSYFNLKMVKTFQQEKKGDEETRKEKRKTKERRF